MSVAPARALPYRGRFAPSPTGPLHFGSLIAALASCADARAAGGEWLVRIEDVDVPRTRAGAEDDIMATLLRYGFLPDGEVVRQSDRVAMYANAVARLARDDLVFACTCSRAELETAPAGAGGERIYPGTCRDLGLQPGPGARHALRMRVGEGEIEWFDRLQGAQRENLARDVGDFVVRRADRLHAYQLAVVVDDAAQQVTDVVRGADLMSSTRTTASPAARARSAGACLPAPAGRDQRRGRKTFQADPGPRASGGSAAGADFRMALPRAAGTRGDAAHDRGLLGIRRPRLDGEHAAAGGDAARATRHLVRCSRAAPGGPYGRRIIYGSAAPRQEVRGPPFTTVAKTSMTTLVVVRKGDEIAIAADSLTTFGDTRLAAVHDRTFDKIVQYQGNYIGLCGSAAHQLVFESLLRRHEDLDFSSRFAIFETFRKLHPILKEQHFLNPKEEEDDPYESTQVTALIANAHGIFGVYSMREVFEYTQFWAAGSGREFALGAMHANYPRRRTAAAVARAGLEAGALFDKNSALPLTLYTLKVGGG